MKGVLRSRWELRARVEHASQGAAWQQGSLGDTGGPPTRPTVVTLLRFQHADSLAPRLGLLALSYTDSMQGPVTEPA